MLSSWPNVTPHERFAEQERRRTILGIVGGLGPLASAEFLKTIYKYGIGASEQSAARVLMYSDPTFPDRSEALLTNSRNLLLAKLTDVLRSLWHAGAETMVICCVTIHILIPELPDDLRGKILSLVDVIFEGVVASKKKTPFALHEWRTEA